MTTDFVRRLLQPNEPWRRRPSSCNILVKARQGGTEPAREPKRAKDKEAFGVGQVVHDIANAPFPWRVTIQGAVPRDAAEQREGVGQLTLENLANVACGYLIDVGEIVLRRFGAIWNGDHVTRFSCVALRGRRPVFSRQPS